MNPLNSKPSRENAVTALNSFLPHAGRAYANGRNFDFGTGRPAHVSRLSPFIRRRLLIEREVVEAAFREHGQNDAEKFIQEVFWRTYWKGWLELRPQVWSAYRVERQARLRQLEDRPKLGESYSRAIHGQTGIDAFDAWAGELVDNGYLHNHARMWFASIWIFTLNLPWELGADFFFQHLLDGDPASNTLGWRWVAGIQTPGKHYVATASNISKFTGGRFQPSRLDEDPEPLQYEENRSIQPLPKTVAPSDLLNRPCGLILTPEDCLPERSPVRNLPVKAIFHGLPEDLYRSYQIAEPVRQWSAAALNDAARRAVDHFQCPITNAATTSAYKDRLLQWARENQLPDLACLLPPVGPWRDQLESARLALAPEGIRLHFLRRSWDHELYPKATKGFFAFKKHIPAILDAFRSS